MQEHWDVYFSRLFCHFLFVIAFTLPVLFVANFANLMLLNSEINANVKFKEKELVGTLAAGCASV